MADSYAELASGFQKLNAHYLANSFPVKANEPLMMDVGCGTGFVAAELLEKYECAQITALDPSREMLAEARALITSSRCTFTCSSLMSYETSKTYDAIFSNAALHWLYPDYDAAFARLGALLRTGGALRIATAGKTSESVLFDADMTAIFRSADLAEERIPFSDRRLTPEEAADLAEKAGFEIEDCFSIGRSRLMPVETYARWLVASGGPWRHDDTDPERMVERLTSGLLQLGSSMQVGHWTTVLVARKQRLPDPDFR